VKAVQIKEKGKMTRKIGHEVAKGIEDANKEIEYVNELARVKVEEANRAADEAIDNKVT